MAESRNCSLFPRRGASAWSARAVSCALVAFNSLAMPLAALAADDAAKESASADELRLSDASLSGWSEVGNAGWQAENGEIWASAGGEDGMLITSRSYHNFPPDPGIQTRRRSELRRVFALPGCREHLAPHLLRGQYLGQSPKTRISHWINRDACLPTAGPPRHNRQMEPA